MKRNDYRASWDFISKSLAYLGFNPNQRSRYDTMTPAEREQWGRHLDQMASSLRYQRMLNACDLLNNRT